jgi:hypothetical protein
LIFSIWDIEKRITKKQRSSVIISAKVVIHAGAPSSLAFFLFT